MPNRALPPTRKRFPAAFFVPFLLLSSCFRERIVYQAQSEFQDIVVTEQRGDVRTLRFGRRGTAQSQVKLGQPETLLMPYVRASMVGLAFVHAPRRILVVGLGGGSIPSFLHWALPEATIDVVEIDSVVLEVAREWFGFVEDERLSVTVGDGRGYIESVEEPYDLVVLDAYDAVSVPRSLTTLEFLRSVRQAVAPEGAVVANVWSRRTNRLYGAMAATYQAAFEELYIFEPKRQGNRIFVALPRRMILHPAELEGRLSARSDGLDLDLARLAGKGDRRVTERSFDAELLLDPVVRESGSQGTAATPD